MEEMVKRGYALGGEQSGHIIFADHLFTGETISVESNGSALSLQSIIKSFSVALLTGETKIGNV